MSKELNIDVRAFPIENPLGSTKAFASVTFYVGETPINAINGIRVVESQKGAFIAMPQTKDKNGTFQDIAFPVMKGLRTNMSKAIFAELDSIIKGGNIGESHLHLGAKLPENGIGMVSASANMTPINNPRGNTLAFGNVTFKIDDKPFSVIEGVRVVNSAEKGPFVTMPQSKDKNGEYHDIAFPVMKGLRGEITEVVLKSYDKAVLERGNDKGNNFSDRLAAGQNKTNEYKQATAQKSEQSKATAKSSPGLGD